MKNLPPPIWGALLLLATYGLSLAPVVRDLPYLQNTPVGVIVLVVGLGVGFFAANQFRVVGTQISPISPTNDKLVTSGLFSFTRNPMYVGMVLITLGVAIWVGPLIMYAAPVLLFAIANWVHIPFEEAKMRRQFGDAFDAYCKRVRRWL